MRVRLDFATTPGSVVATFYARLLSDSTETLAGTVTALINNTATAMTLTLTTDNVNVVIDTLFGAAITPSRGLRAFWYDYPPAGVNFGEACAAYVTWAAAKQALEDMNLTGGAGLKYINYDDLVRPNARQMTDYTIATTGSVLSCLNAYAMTWGSGLIEATSQPSVPLCARGPDSGDVAAAASAGYKCFCCCESLFVLRRLGYVPSAAVVTGTVVVALHAVDYANVVAAYAALGAPAHVTKTAAEVSAGFTLSANTLYLIPVNNAAVDPDDVTALRGWVDAVIAVLVQADYVLSSALHGYLAGLLTNYASAVLPVIYGTSLYGNGVKFTETLQLYTYPLTTTSVRSYADMLSVADFSAAPAQSRAALITAAATYGVKCNDPYAYGEEAMKTLPCEFFLTVARNIPETP